MIKVNNSGISPVMKTGSVDYAGAVEALKILKSGKGTGNDFTGWLSLPYDYDKNEFGKIKEVAGEIRKEAEALVVIGIGGSYLGSRMAVELLKSARYNETAKKTPNIYFAGNGISGDELSELVGLVRDKNLYINVISKSGTTLEPALAFRVFRNLLTEKYGKEESRKRIICTTDKARGVLKGIADAEGYRTFVIPDNVGGRYSIFTPVGLLPLAVTGIDIDTVMKYASQAMDAMKEESENNPAVVYAATRRALYDAGKKVEVFSYPGERAKYLAEWWKQLYGESEGKDGKGIYPTSCQVSADLHSLGQYIQDGERILLETMFRFESSANRPELPKLEKNDDGLDYLLGRNYDDIFLCAFNGIKEAHMSGGVPCIEICAEKADEKALAEIVIFFEVACGISGYMQGCNPFNQPGVEEYKKNMFRLLGR